MGIMQPYFPKEAALKMAALANADLFVETGTYYGNTAKWASEKFGTVFTIELSDYLYNLTKDELLSKGNIVPKLGNSKNVLPCILENIDSNIVFWLDGHYSHGVTAGADDPCPLREELRTILKRENDDIILIDDARCYATEEEGFPSIAEICRIVDKNARNKRCIQICNDCIYIVPDKEEYKELLFGHVLTENILLWETCLEFKNEKEKLIHFRFNIKALKMKISALRSKFYISLVNILKKAGLYNIARKIIRGP